MNSVRLASVSMFRHSVRKDRVTDRIGLWLVRAHATSAPENSHRVPNGMGSSSEDNYLSPAMKAGMVLGSVSQILSRYSLKLLISYYMYTKQCRNAWTAFKDPTRADAVAKLGELTGHWRSIRACRRHRREMKHFLETSIMYRSRLSKYTFAIL